MAKTIWINLFVPSFTSNLEVALDVAYIHEMIHCMGYVNDRRSSAIWNRTLYRCIN